ncbi:MAG: glycine cleavage system aminomethyltransferase GcvT [Halobacteriales archaeon]|nr:glycine cleavage system aminomethyltransferase GcvT [Halobacteriales archaeon]
MATRKPPLFDVHDDRGASFTEFGGWDMPVEFDSIREEHTAVRESVGIFDVSHMGEIEVTGPDATTLLNRLTTNDVAALDVGGSQYAMITDENGVILDDTVIYRQGEDAFLFIPNAGHDKQMEDRWIDHRDRWELDATVENVTDERAMFAVQGPDSPELVAEVTAEPLDELPRFDARTGTVEGVECWIGRTGYTGEDGFEFVLPWDDAETVWHALDCQPCGLGARDTLRMEAGFLLSGQDFDPEENPRNPYEAGVSFAVDLEKDADFVGREALEQAAEGVDEEFVGFTLTERGVPRHGYSITDTDGTEIGTVTSGTMSPTLGEPIGLGYVPVEYTDPGTEIHVVIRDQPKKAKIQPLPFLSD